MFTVLMGLWICQVHIVASLGLLAQFLLAVCTAGFYGVFFWIMYVALEPFVRRQWPQVLVSWTNVLTGHVRDPVVGRDVLIGVALGVAWALMIRTVDVLSGGNGISGFPGSTELLSGLRGTVGIVLEEAPYAIRNALLYFFLLFVLRVILRGQWRAALAFVGVFAVLSALGNDHPWLGALMGFLYFGSGAFTVLRWGLVSLATGTFVAAVLMDAPATLDGVCVVLRLHAAAVRCCRGPRDVGVRCVGRGSAVEARPSGARRSVSSQHIGLAVFPNSTVVG